MTRDLTLINLTSFHLSDPVHHPCDLLLFKGEDPAIFPTISMAFLLQCCMSYIMSHVHKIFSWDSMVTKSSWRHFAAGNLICVVKPL